MKRLSLVLAVVLLGLVALGPTYAGVVHTVVTGGGGGGSGMPIGGAIVGGTATRVLFVDSNGKLAQDADLTFAADRLTVTKITDSVAICDNGDPTKCWRVEASGITAGQTRVLTPPDGDVTIPSTVASLSANSFTGAQTFASDLIFATHGRGAFGTKTLVDAAATDIVRVSVAAGAGTAGILQWGVFSTNGTDHQSYSGQIYFSAVNKASTETCTTPTIIGTALLSASVGTLTCTYACDVTPADAVDIQLNCDTSLTPTTFEARWYLQLTGPGTITAQ